MNLFIIANNKNYDSQQWKKYTKHQDLIICLNKISNTYFPIFRGCVNNIQKIQKCNSSNIQYGIASKNCDYWLKQNGLVSKNCSVKIDCDKKLLELVASNNRKPIKPSTGFITGYHYSTRYPNSQIYLVGFTFSGSIIHNWKAEKDWCKRKDNIIIL